MANAPFGNDGHKIGRYQAFWDRAAASRPMVGFSLVGWFPLLEFAASRGWMAHRYLLPDMLDVQSFVDDHVRMLRDHGLFHQ